MARMDTRQRSRSDAYAVLGPDLMEALEDHQLTVVAQDSWERLTDALQEMAEHYADWQAGHHGAKTAMETMGQVLAEVEDLWEEDS